MENRNPLSFYSINWFLKLGTQVAQNIIKNHSFNLGIVDKIEEYRISSTSYVMATGISSFLNPKYAIKNQEVKKKLKRVDS